jgi:hypothetical protein
VLRTANVTGATTTSFTAVTAGSYVVKVAATNLVGDSVASAASTTQTVAAPTVSTDNTPVFSASANSAVAVGASSAAITATAPSGGVVTITAAGNPSDACTFNATTGVITGVKAGSCILTATVPAASPYALGEATKTVSISKASQTITFASITEKTMPGPLALTATASSGLTVTFTASGPCSVSGATVTFTGAGSCSITAAQTGDAVYNSAPTRTQSFNIVKAAQTISFTLPSGAAAELLGPGSITGANATSGLTIVFTSTTSNVCTVSGTTIAYIAIGTCSVTGTQSGNNSYLSGTATRTFNIIAAGTGGGGAGGGGGGFGGGGLPAATPTPTATPTATPTPTPTPTPSATATPTPTPTPAASATPSATSAPKPPASLVAVAPVGTKPSKTVAVSGTKASVSVAPGKSVQVALPSIPKGTPVNVTLTDAKGKKYTISTAKSTGSKTFNAPALTFPKAGTYKVTVKYGKVTKVITIVVKK